MKILILIILLSNQALASIIKLDVLKKHISPQSDIEYLKEMTKKLKEREKELNQSVHYKKRTRSITNQDKNLDEFDDLEAKYFDDITTKSAAPKRNKKMMKRER